MPGNSPQSSDQSWPSEPDRPMPDQGPVIDRGRAQARLIVRAGAAAGP
jgi:hypothetical protein